MYGGSGYSYRHRPVPCGNATRVGMWILTPGDECRWALWGAGQCLLQTDLRENALAFADAMMIGVEHGCVTVDGGVFVLDPIYHEAAERAVYSIFDAECLARWFEDS